MITLADWLPPASVGLTFTTLGALKIYGWKKGIIGGGGKPAACRLLGRCPSWGKQINIAVIVLFLAIGLGNLVSEFFVPFCSNNECRFTCDGQRGFDN